MSNKIGNFIVLSSLIFLLSCGNKNVLDSSIESIPEDNKIHLFLLAGQSGARGKAQNSDLSDAEKLENKDIQILADGLKMGQLSNIPETPSNKIRFQNTKPGFGDFESEFGPEIGIANVLKARFPKTEDDDPRASIVKYAACGSTFIDDWMSESTVEDTSININTDKIIYNEKLGKKVGPLTNNMYQMIDRAKGFYDDLGYETVFDGVIFIHGEQDTKFDANMDIYEKCLSNFIKDTRNYLGDDKMPFVITEALTNSGKHCNKLREIQKRIATTENNCIYVSTKDLESNDFEPWHLNAKSNIILGERCASELVRLKDNRTIIDFSDNKIEVEANNSNAIPCYLKAKFEDDTEALVPVSFDKFDLSKPGMVKTNVKATYNGHSFQKELVINVIEKPYVDGNVEEPIYNKCTSHKVGDDMSFKIIKDNEGIYIGAKVLNNQIFTDGENWHIGDMGQMDKNDDLEIFVTTNKNNSGNASDRYSIFLSSANLLRVYDKGVDTTSDDGRLSSKNLYATKKVSGFKHSVTTKNTVNDGSLTSMDMELFVPYSALGTTNGDDLKFLIKYRDVNLKNNNKITENHYFNVENLSLLYEKDLGNYISINDLF